MLARLRRWWHSGCSIYSPCRHADLDAAWQDFKRRVDDPATRDGAIGAELLRIAEGRPVQWPSR